MAYLPASFLDGSPVPSFWTAVARAPVVGSFTHRFPWNGSSVTTFTPRATLLEFGAVAPAPASTRPASGQLWPRGDGVPGG